MSFKIPQLQLTGLMGLPHVGAGDDLATMLQDAVTQNQLTLRDGDILVIAQKIISKAEGRQIALADVTPSAAAIELATNTHKDPRLVELILSESTSIARQRPGLLIVEHKNGYVHANAGIDSSNIEHSADHPEVLLLPENPDRSAAELRNRLQASQGVELGVIINDSMGRAWRNGTVGHTIGCAGVIALASHIGEEDMFGRELQTTEVAIADELSSAASVIMGQSNQATPVVLIRGAGALVNNTAHDSRELLRDPQFDLFRDW